MLRNAFWTTVVVAATAVAQADILTYLEAHQPLVVPGSDPLVPDFNDGSYWTFDLMVRVYGDDDWTSTLATAELRGGFFFEHPLGGDTPPDPELFDEYPALEWDSYYATTSGATPRFVDAETVNERMYKRALWFDGEDGGDGVFMIARYTVRETCPDAFGMWVRGAHTLRNSGGKLWEFQLYMTDPWPPGDLNWDYRVDQLDLGILLAAYGSTPDDPEWDCRADIDADYDVDQSDLGLLLAHWGMGYP